MRRAAQFAAFLMFAVLASVPTHSQESPGSSVPSVWFDEPEHHASHWKVQFTQPFLTYSQRFFIGMWASFPVPKKSEGSRTDIDIVVRVANAQGQYFPGHDHTHIQVPTSVGRNQALAWSTAIYLRPGSYRVVMLVIDRKSGEHFLWRKSVKIDVPNALPDLDTNLPQVEFSDQRRVHAPVGEELPIHNRHPLRVDVVMNLTGDVQMSVAPDWFRWIRQQSVESALVGSVGALSQLRPANGCVRVSAIDIIHTEITRDRAIADPAVDWQKVREAIRKNRDSVTVDVRTLEGRKKARNFFRQFLEHVISDKTGCGEGMEQVDRAVVIVSDSLSFPSGSENEPVDATAQSGSRFFHMKITSRNVPTYDQVGHMLASLHPRQFNVNDSMDLRNALAKLIADLEKDPATATDVR